MLHFKASIKFCVYIENIYTCIYAVLNFAHFKASIKACITEGKVGLMMENIIDLLLHQIPYIYNVSQSSEFTALSSVFPILFLNYNYREYVR